VGGGGTEDVKVGELALEVRLAPTDNTVPRRNGHDARRCGEQDDQLVRAERVASKFVALGRRRGEPPSRGQKLFQIYDEKIIMLLYSKGNN